MCLVETTQTTTWHAGQDTNSNMLRRAHSESQLQTGKRLQRWFPNDLFWKNTDCSLQRPLLITTSSCFLKMMKPDACLSCSESGSSFTQNSPPRKQRAKAGWWNLDQSGPRRPLLPRLWWLIRTKRYTSRDGCAFGWAATVDRRASVSMSSGLFSTHGGFKQAVRHAFGFPSMELDNLCYF